MSTSSTGLHKWWLQYVASLERGLAQRLRAPVSTLAEVGLPFVFMLLLAVGCWTSSYRSTPEAVYYNNSDLNVTDVFATSFCINPNSPAGDAESLPANLRPCEEDTVMCLPDVANGSLCAMSDDTLWSAVSSFSRSKGPLTIPTLDAYLAISAFTREKRRKDPPTLFSRSPIASLAHYGHLVVVAPPSSASSAGDAADSKIAASFLDYCKSESAMCGLVLHPTILPDMKAADAFAMENDDRVWAILQLSDIPSGGESQVEDRSGNDFIIRMNYTATPWTFTTETPQIQGMGYDFQLYAFSGFLSLQHFVQLFYVNERKLRASTSFKATNESLLADIDEILPFVSTLSAVFEPMPTPSSGGNKFVLDWQYFIPLIALIAVLFPVAKLVGSIVEEKYTQIKEAMLIMGLYRSCYYASWFTTSLTTNIVSAALTSVILKLSIFNYVNLGVIFLLYLSFFEQNSAFAMLLSTFFNNPRAASIFTIFMLGLCSIPIYIFPNGTPTAALKVLSFIPCTAFSQMFNLILSYAPFSYYFGFGSMSVGEFSLGQGIGLMWLSSAVYFTLAMYFDNVLPSAVGQRRHPFFFLSPLCCLFRKCFSRGNNGLTPSEGEGSTRKRAGTLIEPESHPLFRPDGSSSVAIRVYRVWKEYDYGGFCGWVYEWVTGFYTGRCLALRDVSFNLHFGEVTALLGPNGSGKSTLMSIITGMATSTRGEVFIAGHSTKTNLPGCRKFIGYCPQSDIVWPELSVQEHLRFYAMMKGVPESLVAETVESTITMLQLREARYTQASALSGGQRRRLCVGIALIGNSQVLLLDEPTAGMDVEGRRIVYQALYQARESRSVLIATHLLDEADRIGDRILLLKDGELRGSGSSLFLKSKMSVGYIVTCVVGSRNSGQDDDEMVSKLTRFVRDNVVPGHTHNSSSLSSACALGDVARAVPPECQLKGIERRGREVAFRFPLSLLSMGENLFEQLEAHKEELHLRTIGLSLTTLEDVFATVAEGPAKIAVFHDRGIGAVEGVSIQIESSVDKPLLGAVTEDLYGELVDDDEDLITPDTNATPGANFWRHFACLFMKRVHSGKRDRRLLVLQVLLPILFLAIAILIDRIEPPKQPGLRMDASLYAKYAAEPHEEVFWTQSVDEGDVYRMDSQPGAVATAFGPFYSPRRINCTQTNCDQSLSQQLLLEVSRHVPKRHIALGLTGRVPSGQKATVMLHNTSAPHATAQSLNALFGVVNSRAFEAELSQPTTAHNVPMTMGPNEEQMFGLMRRVMSDIFIMIPFMLIPCNTVNFMVREKASGSRHLQWLAGANVAAYWLSSALFDLLCYIVTEVLAIGVLFAFKRSAYICTTEKLVASITLMFAFGLSSTVFSYLLSFFFESAFTAQKTVLAISFGLGFLWVMGEEMLGFNNQYLGAILRYVTYILRLFPAVAFGEGMFIISGVELVRLLYPTRKQSSIFAILRWNATYFSGGIGTSLINMGVTFVCSTALLVALEYARVQRVVWLLGSYTKLGDSDSSFADDVDFRAVDRSVAEEEDAVCAHPTGRREDGITVQHLTKRYLGGRHAAVKDVSFGVRYGEVMGLLGLNGAGKSTTLGIIAGDVVPSSGMAFVNHISVLDSSSRRHIGYCPQYNALIEHMSVKEHLELYARLRGMSEERITRDVPALLEALGLVKYQNVAAGILSGGGKRRASLAIALVGRTACVLLDEPTSGMDAVGRRDTCAIIKRLTRQRSVILTTHLLDEVNALADRVAFIADGRLRCIGTPQELQSRYTEKAAYTVVVAFTVYEPVLDTAVGADDVELTSQLPWAEVPQALQRYLSSIIATNSPQGGGRPRCFVESINGRSVTLRVHAKLSSICHAAAGLKDPTGAAKHFPRVTHISATQQTLEDILLLKDEDGL